MNAYKFLAIAVMLFFHHSLKAQVNLQTGAADINIPLYSYNDPNNRLATAVSLNYTAGNGLKVSEVASAVGTGWALNAGGYIQRIQNGAPDDQKNNDTYTYPFLPNSDPNSAFWVWAKNYYPNGYLYSEFSPADQMTNRGGFTPMYGSQYTNYKRPQKFEADREQDVFRFSFNGKEGSFVISKKDANGVSEIRTLQDSKLKIEKVDGDLGNNQNIRTTISEFAITDEQGIKYVFRDADLEEVCDYNQVSKYNETGTLINSSGTMNTNFGSNEVRVTRGTPQNSFTKNKWSLSEIINPMTNVRIKFSYETYNVDMEGNKIIQQTYSSKGSHISITIERLKGTVKRLKQIELSNKETVVLEYEPYFNRVDLPTDKSLLNLVVKYDNQTKYKWNFKYGYFVKNEIRSTYASFSEEEKAWARLCLLELKKLDASNTGDLPYTFSYYMGNEEGRNSAIPPQFSVQQDMGGYYASQMIGYYNPSTNTINLNNQPYEAYGNRLFSKAFYETILSWIPYVPSNFDGYNTVPECWEARNGIIKSFKNPMNGMRSYEYEPNKIGTQSNSRYFGVRVKKVTEEDGNTAASTKATEYKYTDENGNSSAWGYEALLTERASSVKVFNCGSGENPIVNLASYARPVASIFLNPGGTTGPFAGSTMIGGTPVPTFAVAYFANILILMFSGSTAPTYRNYDLITYTSQPVNNGNYLPFQYARVEVTNTVGNNNVGRTTYEFTSPASGTGFTIDAPTLAEPYASKQRYAYCIYGLPEKISAYDKNNKLLKKTVYTYQPIKTVLTNTRYQSQKWVPIKYIYGCGFNPEPQENTNTDRIASEIYYPLCGRIELTKTDEYTYNESNQSSVVTTNYEYSPNNYQVKRVTTTNAKGEQLENFIMYPLDYNTSVMYMQVMRDRNMVNTPIATYSYITKPSGKYMTAAAVSSYEPNGGNGDISVKSVYELVSDVPVLASSIPVTGSTLIPMMRI